LIEAAGLKGKKIGNAQISPLHANFFLNLGDARAADVYALIQEARKAVREHSGIELELEIEMVGEWPAK
jgi:UDP-N-acetylmuramate dehydrogenase